MKARSPPALTLALAAVLFQAAAALAAPQIVPPPTISCRAGCSDMTVGGVVTSVKWCSKCTMRPVHCTLEFSLPCDADTTDLCVLGLGDPDDCAARGVKEVP